MKKGKRDKTMAESEKMNSMGEKGAPSVPVRSLAKTVIGSSFLWAWGFLSYLSPALFPETAPAGVSTGLEYGFFASQAAVVVFAVLVVTLSKCRSLVVRRWTFFAAAVLIALTTFVLAWALSVGLLVVVIVCGAIDGAAVTLMGVAWGARYSLGSSTMRPLVVISFLIAYLVYLIVAHLPQPLSLIIACLLPLCSWALWVNDATARHELSSEVFPQRVSTDSAMPGELTAGSWETRVLPWRSIGVLIAAAFIGNLVSSVVMGRAYTNVDSLFFGGIIVCACIATMSLVPLASDRNALSVGSVYRITVTFSAVGLVSMMVFGAAGVPVGGALVQGSAFFLQVLVFLVITQSTQEQGLSPLLSFSVGQGLIAAVVFAGNVLGKQIFEYFGSGDFVLNVVCGCSVLALFFMLVARAARPELQGKGKAGETEGVRGQTEAMHVSEGAQGAEETSSNSVNQAIEAELQNRIRGIAAQFDLTRREVEVFEYLARGRSLPYIADTLFVTTGTIKTHTTHIYRKLEVNSKQELLDLFESRASE